MAVLLQIKRNLSFYDNAKRSQLKYHGLILEVKISNIYLDHLDEFASFGQLSVKEVMS